MEELVFCGVHPFIWCIWLEQGAHIQVDVGTLVPCNDWILYFIILMGEKITFFYSSGEPIHWKDPPLYLHFG